MDAFKRPLKIEYDEACFARAEELLYEMFKDYSWDVRESSDGVATFVPDSSAGFCDLWKATNKKDWVDECYPDIYDRYVAELESGSRYPIWKHSLKEEILPIEENAVKKSRVFMFADCAFNLYEYCYTSHLDDQLIENCLNKNWFGGGLPTTGLHWDALTRMFMKHPRDIEADASQYDASMTQSMLFVPYKLRCRLAANPGEVDFPLRLIYSHYAHSVMLGVYGNMYLKNEGFNSGTRTTLSDNCLRTIFSYLYACVRKLGQQATLEEIKATNCVATCGDDLRASSSNMTMEDVILYGRELGIKWNPPEPFPETRADVSFISCKTVTYKGVYVPVADSDRGLVSAAYSERPWDPTYNVMRYCGILLSNPFNLRTREYLYFYKQLTMRHYDDLEDPEFVRACALFDRCYAYGHNLYLKEGSAKRIIFQGKIVGLASNRFSPQKQKLEMSNRRKPTQPIQIPAPTDKAVLDVHYAPAPPRRRRRPAPPRNLQMRTRRGQIVRSPQQAQMRRSGGQLSNSDVNKVIRAMSKLTTEASQANRAANKTATQNNRTVDESRLAKHAVVQKYAQDLSTVPECVRNYMQIMSNPFLPVQGKWCSIASAPALVVPSNSYIRQDFTCTEKGEFAVVLNSFTGAKDKVGVCWSGAGAIGANIDSTGYAGLAPTQLLHDAASLTPPGAYEQCTRGRVVAAGICVAPIGNAFNTQGQIYSYTTNGNDLTQKLPVATITSDRNAPRATTLLSKCYANVYCPTSVDQQGWINNQLTIPQPHIFDTANQGFNIVLYGSGFEPYYPMHLEYAVYFEYADSTQFSQFAQRTESHPKAAALINETVNAVKQNHVETEPKKGFFEKVVDGIGYVVSKVVEYAPAVIGGLALL